MADATAGVRTIVDARVEDGKFSADGTQFITASDSAIDVYDVASGARTGHFELGTDLGAIDVSADGRFVAVIEQDAAPNAADGADYAVHVLDLSTGGVTTYADTLDGFYAPFSDVAFAADGTLLLSRATYAGPLYTLDPTTGAFGQTEGSFGRGAVLATTADHALVFADPQSAGDTPLYLLDPVTGARTEYHDYYDPYAGASVQRHDVPVSAISPDGRFAIQGYELQVFDADLQPLVSLAERYPYLAPGRDGANGLAGLAFSPDGDRLFLLDAASQRVIGFDTASWEAVVSYPIGGAVVGYDDQNNGFLRNPYGDSLSVSADGHTLSVLGSGGVTLIDLATVAPDGGTSGDDVLTGSGAVYGFAGADDLTAAGETTLYGGEGDDTYRIGEGFQNAVELAGEGIDTVISGYSFFLGENVENLTLTAADGYGFGNALDNVLRGAVGAQTLAGLDGDDVLAGGAGDDVLAGGTGADRIDGGDGADRLYSAAEAFTADPYHLIATGTVITDGTPDEAGPDTGTERDVLNGGAGDDYLSAGYGDAVDGGAGSDRLALSLIGSDRAVSLAAADLVAGAVTIGAGTLRGIEQVDALWGSDFDDDLDATGQAGAILLDGRGGDDVLTGGAGADTLIGGAGADHASGGAGEDTFAVQGGDIVAGDVIAGGAGSDLLAIGAGYVDLSVAAMSSVERLAAGADATVGVTIAQADGFDAITGGTLALTTGGTIAFAGVTLDLDTIQLADAATSISLAGAITDGVGVIGGAGGDTIIGSAGADRLSGGMGADRIQAGAGDDMIRVSEGEAVRGDSIDGGSGYDAIQIGGYGMVDLSTTTIAQVEALATDEGAQVTLGRAQIRGFDSLHGDVTVADAGALDLGGMSVAGTLRLAAGGNRIDLGDALGTLDVLGGAGADTIRGGAYDDYLEGGGGADTIDGGAGNDVIAGGAGDILSGGAGADLFYFDAPFDGAVIEDFDAYDTIVIAASGALPLTNFVGTGAFNGIAGEGRYAVTADGLRIEVDLDGDRVADNVLTVHAGSTELTVEPNDDGSIGLAPGEERAATDAILLAFDGAAASVGGEARVVGTAGVQDVTVLADRPSHVAFDGSFNLGGDRIHLSGDAAAYAAMRDGSTVTLTDGTTEVTIPVGQHGADIIFDDGARTLAFDAGAGQVMLGDQVIGGDLAPVSAPAETPQATGAIDPQATAMLVIAAEAEVSAGGNLRVFGTDQAETLTLTHGSSAVFDASFNQGGDQIVLGDAAATFTAHRDGSLLVLDAGDAALSIPVGREATTISFDGDARELFYDAEAGTIMLGDQAIGGAAVTLDPATTFAADAHAVAMPVIDPAVMPIDPGGLLA